MRMKTKRKKNKMPDSVAAASTPGVSSLETSPAASTPADPVIKKKSSTSTKSPKQLFSALSSDHPISAESNHGSDSMYSQSDSDGSGQINSNMLKNMSLPTGFKIPKKKRSNSSKSGKEVTETTTVPATNKKQKVINVDTPTESQQMLSSSTIFSPIFKSTNMIYGDNKILSSDLVEFFLSMCAECNGGSFVEEGQSIATERDVSFATKFVEKYGKEDTTKKKKLKITKKDLFDLWNDCIPAVFSKKNHHQLLLLLKHIKNKHYLCKLL